MVESPSVTTSSCCSTLKNPDCYTLSTTIQCFSETNEVPTATELVVVTHKMIECDDKHRELVIGKETVIPLHFSDSELV